MDDLRVPQSSDWVGIMLDQFMGIYCLVQKSLRPTCSAVVRVNPAEWDRDSWKTLSGTRLRDFYIFLNIFSIIWIYNPSPEVSGSSLPLQHQGDKVVKMNIDGVDASIEGIVQVDIPAAWASLDLGSEAGRSMREVREVFWSLDPVIYTVIYLSAYAWQPARGPTIFAQLVAILAHVGLMLTQVEPKNPKNGNGKRTPKRFQIP